ncbi:MAG: ABC transporter ATP-binding protein [Phycisphaerae bacterium]|nr:ABC transporter ATP-binding protein [Phycisphaerae bacterium]
MALIKLENICKQYDQGNGDENLAVLKGINLEIRRSDAVAIVGPSGSGKSTLLNLIGTLDKPSSGTIEINGVNINSLDDKELALLRNEHIGFVFQDHHLLNQCSVMENVMLPTLAGGHCNKHAKDRATELLISVGLADKANSRPAELSGGQKQRVAMARALMNQPTILLADEPTGNLDHNTATELVDLLCKLNQEEGITLIVATHWPELARRMDNEYHLRDGVII